MGTDFYHPGQPKMEEQRSEEPRKTVADAVRDIDTRTARTDTFFFGPPGQEYNGWIARTDRRLDELDNPQIGRVSKLERRILVWIGAMSVIGPTAALLINYYFRGMR